MTPKQKYLFDLRGYLHLENVLTPQELGNAQAAIERLVKASPDELPAGISRAVARDFQTGSQPINRLRH